MVGETGAPITFTVNQLTNHEFLTSAAKGASQGCRTSGSDKDANHVPAIPYTRRRKSGIYVFVCRSGLAAMGDLPITWPGSVQGMRQVGPGTGS